jgi:surface antigen-like variable number repeat protein
MLKAHSVKEGPPRVTLDVMASFILSAALQAPPVEATAAAPRPVAEEQLTQWLADARPVLRSVEISGLEHTREALVRRELGLQEGDLLDADRLREARLRLGETRVFESALFRVQEVAPRHAVLEVDLDERHGFGNVWNLLGRGAVDALRKKVRVRYSNLAGRGLSFLVEHKWERTQPSLSIVTHAVRPLGLPANLAIVARRSRPMYDLEDDGEDPFTLRTRGLGVIARRVVAPGTVLEVGAVEHDLWEAPRHRVNASLRFFHAVRALGSDLEYTRGLLGVSYRWWPNGRGNGSRLPRSEVAAQAYWGRGSSGLPLDDMFSPGAASEMEFPLRAHRQKRDGILGRGPIGQDLLSANLEWRRSLLTIDRFRVGAVAFYDVAHTGRSPQGPQPTLHDVGVGLRLQGKSHSILRVDFGHSFTDGNNALTAGIGHAF